MSIDTAIDAARSCLGAPFRHQGRNPSKGLDCAGLIIYALKQGGFQATDEPGYTRSPQPHWMSSVLDRIFVPVDSNDVQRGDVLWMRFQGDPQHLALYTGKTIIHAMLRKRKVIEHSMDAQWWARVAQSYRHRELVS